MKPSSPSVVIMAGGTGGHIFPGLAVADRFREHGVKVRWLGAEGGMECRQVAEHGIEVDQVKISGVRGKGVQGWILLPFRLARAVFDASASMGRNQPNCALSFGGYVAGPGGIAAWLRGVPLVVHEQNQVPGMTNKTLARVAKKVLQAFPGTFPRVSGAVTCGNPVRESVVGLPAPEQRFFQRSGRPRLLVTGGSQGARALNTIIPQALKLLPEELRPLVCHQSGESDFSDTQQAYTAAGVDADVHRFIKEMADAYAWADLVICRSGALTVSELAVAGVGAILVPFPHAVDDHQTRNAAYLVKAGAARLIPQKDLEAASLAKVLGTLFADRPAMLDMASAARSVAVTDAAEQVYEHCTQWVKQT
jgi:UDP-N-acetylglucosamine--N-acetylmuramyl-(pentapeptide) pyrophosphoryl-undecaprenol N-acetylglucosamine transferase